MTSCGRNEDAELDRDPSQIVNQPAAYCEKCHTTKSQICTKSRSINPSNEQSNTKSINQATQCVTCFLTNFQSKLKGSIRRSGVQMTHSVTIAISGGLSSSVLDRCISVMEGVDRSVLYPSTIDSSADQSINPKTRLGIKIRRVHIDCSALRGIEIDQAINESIYQSANLPLEIYPLSAVFDIVNDKAGDISFSRHRINQPTTPASSQSESQSSSQTNNAITNSRAEQDAKIIALIKQTPVAHRYHLVMSLILRLLSYINRSNQLTAQSNNQPIKHNNHLLIGGSSMNAAIGALQWITHGVGQGITQSINHTNNQTMFYSNTINPMVDFSMKSIALYGHYFNLSQHIAPEVYKPMFSNQQINQTINHSNKPTIDSIIHNFVQKMDGMFDQTIPNVTRTIAKLEPVALDVQPVRICCICSIPIGNHPHIETNDSIRQLTVQSNALICCYRCKSAFGSISSSLFPPATICFDTSDVAAISNHAGHQSTSDEPNVTNNQPAATEHGTGKWHHKPMIPQSREAMRAAIADFLIDSDPSSNSASGLANKREERRKAREQNDNDSDSDTGLGLLEE